MSISHEVCIHIYILYVCIYVMLISFSRFSVYIQVWYVYYVCICLYISMNISMLVKLYLMYAFCIICHVRVIGFDWTAIMKKTAKAPYIPPVCSGHNYDHLHVYIPFILFYISIHIIYAILYVHMYVYVTVYVLYDFMLYYVL